MARSMSRRRIGVLGVVAVALVLVPVLLVLSGSRTAASSTVLTILDGTAAVAHGANEFAPGTDGELMAVGDRVRTSPSSHAGITVFDRSTPELQPATTVTIDQASTTRDAISIRISQGVGPASAR